MVPTVALVLLLLRGRGSGGRGRGRALGVLGSALRDRGELPRAVACLLAARRLGRATHDAEGEAFSLNSLGNVSLDLRQYRQGLRYYEQSKDQYTRLNRPHWVAGSLTNLGSCYEKMGVLQARLGHSAEAFGYYRRTLRETTFTNDFRNRAVTQYHMARLYNTLGQPDSSLQYARLALRSAAPVAYRATLMDASSLLARLYQARHQPDSAYRYQTLAAAARDSLFGPEKFRQLQRLSLAEQQREELNREKYILQKARYQRVLLLVALVVFLIIALLLGWANRQHRRTNQLLNRRNATIEAQRNELYEALPQLRTAQAQLVAAEK